MIPDIKFRSAKEEDIYSLIRLILDNEIGSSREDINNLSYYIKAFRENLKSKNDHLIVMEKDQEIIEMTHLTILTHLSLKLIRRGNIETVHIKSTYRNKSYGTMLMNYVINLAKELGAEICQLTTNKRRVDAKHFYKKLGFVATHEGLKFNI